MMHADLIQYDRIERLRLESAYALIMSWPRINAPVDVNEPTAEPLQSAAVDPNSEIVHEISTV